MLEQSSSVAWFGERLGLALCFRAGGGLLGFTLFGCFLQGECKRGFRGKQVYYHSLKFKAQGVDSGCKSTLRGWDRCIWEFPKIGDTYLVP